MGLLFHAIILKTHLVEAYSQDSGATIDSGIEKNIAITSLL